MRYEEALEKHGGYDSLTDYERGAIDALYLYAWSKDGALYVGSTGKLLGDAVDEFLTRVGS